jgi:choline dehydrogenase-like flavoprotein
MNQGEHYDAIVIGTGITGGWAAKELCENGLKTLVLERDRMVRHIEDYPTMNMYPWDFPYRNELSSEDRKKYHKQLRINWAPNNQLHSVPNVYVTDGAFMASASCVNPSLTYMAFTARAADHAAREFRAGRLS